MIVFVYGPPKVGDLNFIPRVFGKGLPEPREGAGGVRVVRVLSPEHLFQLRSASWFWRTSP